MGLLDKLNKFAKAGDVVQRAKAAKEKKKQADDEKKKAMDAERLAAKKAAKPVPAPAPLAVVREPRPAKTPSRPVNWGDEPIIRKSLYESVSDPYRGARQISFFDPLRDSPVRLDEAALEWIKFQMPSSHVRIRVVMRNGGVFEQTVLKDKLASVVQQRAA